jgi:hypothetical protein
MWKEELRVRHTVARFSDSAALAALVREDLNRTVEDFYGSQSEDKTFAPGSADGALDDVLMIARMALAKGANKAGLLRQLRRTVYRFLEGTASKGPSVFLCHSTVDDQSATVVANSLRLLGLEVFLGGDGWNGTSGPNACLPSLVIGDGR